MLEAVLFFVLFCVEKVGPLILENFFNWFHRCKKINNLIPQFSTRNFGKFLRKNNDCSCPKTEVIRFLFRKKNWLPSPLIVTWLVPNLLSSAVPLLLTTRGMKTGHFDLIARYIVAVSFIGRGNRSTRRKQMIYNQFKLKLILKPIWWPEKKIG